MIYFSPLQIISGVLIFYLLSLELREKNFMKILIIPLQL